MTEPHAPAPFRLAYVPGVTTSKWVRIWRERLPDAPLELLTVEPADVARLLRAGDADAGLVRLPIDQTGLSAISLYTETPVVVVPKEHLFTAVDAVRVEDLTGEIVLHPLDDTLAWDTVPGTHTEQRPATTADAIDLVAAGIGVLVVPQSLARLHHRKDLTYRTVTDAPESPVALAWPEDANTELVEEFVGIVRGRTTNSTRGRADQEPAPKRTASEKTAAKAAAKAAAGKLPSGKGLAVKGTAGKGLAVKGTASKGSAGKGTAGKGSAGKGSASKGSAGKVPPTKGTSGKAAASRRGGKGSGGRGRR